METPVASDRLGELRDAREFVDTNEHDSFTIGTMTLPKHLRIGTRGSLLARAQTEIIANALRARGCAIEIVEISTRGDRVTDQSIETLGGTGVFTLAIQDALRDGRVDIAVHSLKDLPVAPVAGVCLAAVPVRANPADVLVAKSAKSLDDLPSGARVGTSSPRRRAQLLHVRPDLIAAPIRGNVDTRIRKLDDGEYDALILASAGLERIGLADRITEALSIEDFLPAAGQGALGVECRDDDDDAARILQAIDDANLHAAALAERSVLRALGAGCSTAIGVFALVRDDALQIEAAIYNADGTERAKARTKAKRDEPVRAGDAIAEEIIQQGGERWIFEK